jgi:hypothetical protein
MKGAFYAICTAAGLLAGCGGGISGYCEEANLCEEGNDLDVEACETRLDTEAEVADLYNCSSEFDEYFDCLVENSRCNNDRYAPDEDDCDGPRNRLDDCTN